MSIIDKWLSSINIRKKLTAAYLLFGLVPLVMVTIYTYHSNRTFLIDHTYKDMAASLEQLCYGIRETITVYNGITDQLYSNRELSNQLNADYHNQDYEGHFDYTEDLFRYIMDRYPDIMEISIYSTNKTIPESSSSFYHLEEGQQPDWFPAVDAHGKLMRNQKTSFMIFRKLNLYETDGNTHILKIEVSNKAINQLLANTSPGTAQIITDPEGVVPSQDEADANGSLGQSMVLSEVIKDFGTVVIVADKKGLLFLAGKSAVFIFFSCFAMPGSAFLCLRVYIKHYFRKRMECVREGIGAIGNGDFHYRLPSMGTDEIGEIAGYVNNLACRLELQIETSYKRELKIKQMELDLLQEQINPHFLYNSLSMISALASQQGNDEIRNMACSLSDFYRISLNHGKKTLQIREEIELLERYLKVQNARFKDMVHIELELEENVLCCETMKLILQPVVENAIRYGREYDESILTMVIRVFQRRENVIFEIIDDGIGMRPEEVWTIHEDLKNGSGGFGLRNVDARIKNAYGEAFGLSLESEYGFGTKVTIEIPFIKRAESRYNWQG